MGWTAYYQVIRETPLTESEILTLAEFVRKQRRAPWDAEPFSLQIAQAARADRVIAAGWNKLAMSEQSSDGALLQHALDELAKLVGGELRVRDDFGAYTRGPQLVQLTYGELIDPEKLVAAKPVTVSGSDVNSLLDALVATDDRAQQDQLRASLNALPAFDVATAIYVRYRELSRNYWVQSVLGDAQQRLADPASVAHVFLEAWRNPEGTYFYGDMRFEESFVIGLGRVPDVVAQWTTDIETALQPQQSDLVYRCAEVAIRSLALTGHIRPLLELVRSLRHKTRKSDVEYRLYVPAHRFLLERNDPRTIPTLLLYAAMARREGWWTRGVTTLAKLAPERIRPWATELARRGVHRTDAIQWMQLLGEHTLAAELTARGSAPLTDRAVDVDRTTRHDALRELSKQKDPSTFVSLVLAESLDKYLRARSEDGSVSVDWYDWRDIIEGDGREGTTAKKLKWYELVGKRRLPPQVIWPSVAEIEKVGAAVVAERYASEFLEVPANEIAALEAEEAAIIAST